MKRIMKRTRTYKRTIALVLVFIMAFSTSLMTVFADEPITGDELTGTYTGPEDQSDGVDGLLDDIDADDIKTDDDSQQMLDETGEQQESNPESQEWDTDGTDDETEEPETEENREETLEVPEALGINYIYYDTEADAGDDYRMVIASLDTADHTLDSAALTYNTGTGQKSLSATEIIDGYAAFLIPEAATAYDDLVSIQATISEQDYNVDIKTFVQSNQSEEIEIESGTTAENLTTETVENIEDYVAKDVDEIVDVLNEVEQEIGPTSIDSSVRPAVTAAALATTTDKTKTEDDKSKEEEKEKDGIIIVLDPGHGGNDPGAVAKYNGVNYYERDMVLKISNATKAELEKYAGVKVYMTRTTNNENPSLYDRVKYAADLNADAVISQHINAGGGRGALVIVSAGQYRKELAQESSALANKILAELQSLGFSNKGLMTRLYPDTSANYENGSRGDYYAIVRHAVEMNMIGIIIEHGFIDSSSDIALLNSDAKLTAVGKADAKAIAAYYGLKLKDGSSNNSNNNSNGNSNGNTNGSNNNSGGNTTTETKKGTVTATALNVRKSASTSSAILGTINKGTSVTILETLSGWYKVQVTISGKSVTGYCSSQYISLSSTSGSGNSSGNNNGSTNNGSGTTTTKTGKVNCSALNVRKSASTSAAILGTITKNTSVTILSTSGSWHNVKVTIGGKSVTGYCHIDYITITSTGSTGGSSGGSSAGGGSTSGGSSTGNNTSSAETGKVNCSALNVRKSASTSSAVLGTINKNTQVTILEKQTNWYKVKVKIGSKEVTGYCYASYITLNASSTGGSSGGSSSSGNTSGGSSSSGNSTGSTSTSTGKVNVSALNVRKGASTSTGILGTISKNATVTILETSGSWYKVNTTIGGKTVTGYVFATYITKTSSSSGSGSSGSGSTATASGTGKVNCSALNVRKSASLNGSIIGTISRGTQVTIQEKTGDWYKVKTTVSGKSVTAYVYAQYITKN